MRATKKLINEKKNRTLVKKDTAIAMPPNAKINRAIARTMKKIAHNSIIYFTPETMDRAAMEAMI